MTSSSEMIWVCGRHRFDLTERALVMGILNVTPDSFSDGGKYSDAGAAIAHGLRMVAEGADIVDVGGESSRPGASELSPEEEMARVIPVLEGLRSRCGVALSVDTCKPEVARAALDAGASVVNDITGFRNEEMVGLCAERPCGLVAMHMRGNPRTMQTLGAYESVVPAVRKFLLSVRQRLADAGIADERLCFDPGIGFSKTAAENLGLLKNLPAFALQGRPVMVGVSRKSLVSGLTGRKDILSRDLATLALTVQTGLAGASVHRVHDVANTVQALRMSEKLRQRGR